MQVSFPTLPCACDFHKRQSGLRAKRLTEDDMPPPFRGQNTCFDPGSLWDKPSLQELVKHGGVGQPPPHWVHDDSYLHPSEVLAMKGWVTTASLLAKLGQVPAARSRHQTGNPVEGHCLHRFALFLQLLIMEVYSLTIMGLLDAVFSLPVSPGPRGMAPHTPWVICCRPLPAPASLQ